MRKLEVEYHHQHQLAKSVLLVKTAAANCIAMAATSIHLSPGPKKKKKRGKKNLDDDMLFSVPQLGREVVELVSSR
jgi:hypothetical protein